MVPVSPARAGAAVSTFDTSRSPCDTSGPSSRRQPWNDTPPYECLRIPANLVTEKSWFLKNQTQWQKIGLKVRNRSEPLRSYPSWSGRFVVMDGNRRYISCTEQFSIWQIG